MDEPARSSKPPPEADDQPPPNPNGRIEVELFDASHALCADAIDSLRNLATRALATLPAEGSVRVRLVDDEEMSRAHQRFSGIAGTTDVLTFDLAEPNADNSTLDADLIVCVDQAQRQASQLGHDPIREMLLYIIHGTLHCLGYDDHDPGAYQTMHNKEDEILAAIGVGATFFADPDTQEPRS